MDVPGNTPAPAPDMSTDPGTDPGAGQDQGLIDAIIDAIGGLMPTIIQKVKESQGGDGMPPRGEVGDSSPNGDPGADDAGDTPRGMDEPADDTAGGPPGGGAAPAAPSPGPSADSIPAAPSAPSAPGGAAPSASPAGPIDEQHSKYAAMSPQCAEAYAAGHAAGSAKGRPMNYSKTEATALEERVAAQAKRIEDLERDKRDTERYSKIHAISLAHDIGDEREVLAEVINVEDAEFDRYCKALEKAPKRGDVTNVDLYDDANARFNPETDDYARRQAVAGKGKIPAQADFDRYSRQAADSVIKKKGRNEETTHKAELSLILKAAGFQDDFLIDS